MSAAVEAGDTSIANRDPPHAQHLAQARSTSHADHDRGLQQGTGNARKRIKVTRACDSCKRQKKRCTGDIPCESCIRARHECTYVAQYARGTAVAPLRARARSPLAHPLGVSQDRDGITSHPQLLDPVETSLPTASTTTTPTTSAAPPITESQTQPQPQIQNQSDTVQSCLNSRKTSPEPGAATDIAGQYHGETSAHSFLGRAWRRFDHGQKQSSLVLGPETDADAHLSIFSFGDRKVPEVEMGHFHWPHLNSARQLVKLYFDFAAPTYRVLHKGTVLEWVFRIYDHQEQSLSSNEDRIEKGLPPAAQAVLLMVFAIASMFPTDKDGLTKEPDTDGWGRCELYYQMAQQRLSEETGSPTVESAQARFVTVQYLLSSSRANKAWYVHGTTVQLIMTLGLHRRRTIADVQSLGHIARECRKRVLWCTYTLDKYLSLLLGRPRLLQDEDIDQDFPVHINDEDLSYNSATPKPHKDCVMDAPIFHSKLSRILAKAAKEQYSINRVSDRVQVEASCARSEEIAAWHRQLPPFISGAIQASSLIPIFRRQSTVLCLAHAHALMFVTRPLLLRNISQSAPEYVTQYRGQLKVCIVAAKDAVEVTLSYVQDAPLFASFWFMQYITFNALSIIYIYLIQIKKRRIFSDISINDDDLLELAETGQHLLAGATVRNAPMWRYSAILQGLRSEARSLVHPEIQEYNLQRSGTETIPRDHGFTDDVAPADTYSCSASTSSTTDNIDAIRNSTYPVSLGNAEFGLFNDKPGGILGGIADGMDADMGLDFWPQLDSLSSAYFDFGGNLTEG